MGMDCLGALCDKLCNNSCVKMAVKFGFPKRTDDWMSGRNSKPEGFTVHMNSDTKINFCVKTCLVE